MTSEPVDEVAPAVPGSAEAPSRPSRQERRSTPRRRAGWGGSFPAQFRPGKLPKVLPGHRRFVALSAPSSEGDLVVVDLATSVLARLEEVPRVVGAERLPGEGLGPFAVLDVPSRSLAPVGDPARPEAQAVRAPAVVVGIVGRRRARRLLKSLLAPPEPQLLGFAGPSWPYWELKGDRPSVAVVAPSRGPVVYRRAEDASVWVRFGWHRTDNWLPLTDPLAARALEDRQRGRLGGRALAAALGFRPAYLVVAVGRPHAGYCPKTVVALLPRP